MPFHPYRFFSGGTCREAFTRYQEIFGGDLEIMSFADAPPGEAPDIDQPDLVMHAALTFGDHLLMGSDDPTGDGGPVAGVAIHYTAADADEAERVFGALADGGVEEMPLEETFWAPRFGACVDRHGTSWMVSVDPPEESAST